MTIVWSPEAIADLIALRAYIAKDSPTGAQRVVLRLLRDLETLLPDNPHMGRPGRVTGTRELVVTGTPYIVPYRVQGGEIQILRVYHGARRWPERF